MSDGALVSQSRDVLSHHARSFRWGAFFLPEGAHDDAAVTYAFCRLVDDVVDEAPSSRRPLKGFRAQAELRAMRSRVHSFVALVRSCFGMAVTRCSLLELIVLGSV